MTPIFFSFPVRDMNRTSAKRRESSPTFQARLKAWLAKMDMRFDCSKKDALDHCEKEEDAEWLRRVRANLPASMGARDVIFQKQKERSLKRQAKDAERAEKAKARCEEERKVTLLLLLLSLL